MFWEWVSSIPIMPQVSDDTVLFSLSKFTHRICIEIGFLIVQIRIDAEIFLTINFLTYFFHMVILYVNTPWVSMFSVFMLHGINLFKLTSYSRDVKCAPSQFSHDSYTIFVQSGSVNQTFRAIWWWRQRHTTEGTLLTLEELISMIQKCFSYTVKWKECHHSQIQQTSMAMDSSHAGLRPDLPLFHLCPLWIDLALPCPSTHSPFVVRM